MCGRSEIRCGRRNVPNVRKREMAYFHGERQTAWLLARTTRGRHEIILFQGENERTKTHCKTEHRGN